MRFLQPKTRTTCMYPRERERHGRQQITCQRAARNPEKSGDHLVVTATKAMLQWIAADLRVNDSTLDHLLSLDGCGSCFVSSCGVRPLIGPPAIRMGAGG